jgi:aminopeptidase-like protein
MAMLWVLQLADGAHSLLEVAERAALPFELVQGAAELLCTLELLEEAPPPALVA